MAVVQGFKVGGHGLVCRGAIAFECLGCQLPKLSVTHSNNEAIDRVLCADLTQCYAVFMLYFGCISPRVCHDDGYAPALKLFDQVGYFAIANIGTVFLECDAHDAHFASSHVDAVLQHSLDDAAGGITGHVVVHATASQDDLWVVPQLFGFMRKVIRVHTNAVPPHHAGPEGQEIPLATCSLEDFKRINANALKDDRQFVNKGNIEITLTVLDDLSGLGHLKATGFPGTCLDDGVVKRIHLVGHNWGAATRDLFNGGERVDLVTGVDALRAVAAEKILIELKVAELFQHRYADFFSRTGIDGRLVNDDVASLKRLAYGLAGLNQRRHVRAVGLVYRCRYSDNEDMANLEVVKLAAEMQLGSLFELIRAAFKRVILAGLELLNALLIDVKTQNRTALTKFNS